jgi:hypothetical protein
MVVRIIVTSVMLALAAGAFFGAAPIPANPLNPLGILFLTIAGVIWFAWDVIREGFSYGAGSGRDGTELPLLARFGPVFISGITNAWRTPYPHRRTSKTKSNQEGSSR